MYHHILMMKNDMYVIYNCINTKPLVKTISTGSNP